MYTRQYNQGVNPHVLFSHPQRNIFRRQIPAHRLVLDVDSGEGCHLAPHKRIRDVGGVHLDDNITAIHLKVIVIIYVKILLFIIRIMRRYLNVILFQIVQRGGRPDLEFQRHEFHNGTRAISCHYSYSILGIRDINQKTVFCTAPC